jgi:hypothetical protein
MMANPRVSMSQNYLTVWTVASNKYLAPRWVTMKRGRDGSASTFRRMWKRSHGLAHSAPPTERGGNSDAQTTVTAVG